MKIRLAKKIIKQVYKTRYWAYRLGYYYGKKNLGKIAGDNRLIRAIKLTKAAYESKRISRNIANKALKRCLHKKRICY